MHVRELHSDYYRDRSSEYELCRDFPGDELFIDGLNAMQMHFYNNGVNLEIPVVRVMNTAHFLAAYMLATPCAEDQVEYDALANMSLGRDRKMFKMAIIVLAAMLKRTEGSRAQECRDMLLDNRDPDFEEGVTLYDRFLRSSQTRFEEESFLIDTQQLLVQLQEKNTIIAQQEQTIEQLQITITTMENQQNIQYKQDNNQGTIYNAPVYITYTTPVSQESREESEEVLTSTPVKEESVESIIFTKKAKKEGKEAEIIAALTKSVQGRRDKTRALVDELHSWQNEGYIDAHFNAQVMYDELDKLMSLSFGYDAFKRLYNYSRV